MEKKKYAELWGDRVVLKELALASIIGIVMTMAFYLVASKFFLSNENIEPGLAKGYSLMVGIAGCILSGAISSKLFKPKRDIVDSGDDIDIEGALEAAGLTLEDEKKNGKNADKQSIAEMEKYGLDTLLEIDGLKDNKSTKGGEN